MLKCCPALPLQRQKIWVTAMHQAVSPVHVVNAHWFAFVEPSELANAKELNKAVPFMHVGFAMVETGTCRARNASDLLIKNVLRSVCVGTLGWWSFGWGFAFGEGKYGLIGTTGFFATDLVRETSWGMEPVEDCDGQLCTARVLQCFFQWAFCTTTASIVTRWKGVEGR
eukprot:Skav206138  [mRNA]  locus=scaffold471:40919:43557:+ [translate_table: standard]